MIQFKNEIPLKEMDAIGMAFEIRSWVEGLYAGMANKSVENAIQIASFVHRNQFRRGFRGVHVKPHYIEHPLRVTLRMIRTFNVTDLETIIAAILHDAVEDGAADFSHFYRAPEPASESPEDQRVMALDFMGLLFGFCVRDLVLSLTNPFVAPGTSKAEKLQGYQEHVQTSVFADERVLIIKLSDFIDNAGSLHHHYKPGDSQVQYFLDRYLPLVEVYREALGRASNTYFDVRAALVRLDQAESMLIGLRG